MHMKKFHLNIVKKYACNQCEYTTKDKRDLGEHKKGIHLKQKDLQCMKCDKGFVRRRDLVIHIKAIHQCVLYINIQHFN